MLQCQKVLKTLLVDTWREASYLQTVLRNSAKPYGPLFRNTSVRSEEVQERLFIEYKLFNRPFEWQEPDKLNLYLRFKSTVSLSFRSLVIELSGHLVLFSQLFNFHFHLLVFLSFISCVFTLSYHLLFAPCSSRSLCEKRRLKNASSFLRWLFCCS